MPSKSKSPSKPLTEDEIADLKEAFSMFDTNGDGTIEAKELREVMRSLGQNPTNREVMEMINSVDDNSDGSIDFDEFVILMQSKKSRSDPDKELRDAFKVFDADGNGTISRSELKQLMVNLGQTLSDGELDAMMNMVDTDGNGEICFEEFKQMMQG
mmetsp:Transcript_39640/g.48264  ORF Transcript_39640/g.48264 Transcript_39640/m.48264 type:complete len:156 (-) Transcript_39640:176-643(-)|eukprot:CAMPEP_0172489062 /NCGR_PEP_ID=MMETSP1066-20121228/18820_1 /TAXON_ID=671091 /ORGANISM="Coscinodiscus wailesii, Strain CCMP2513" /LENGTH=155 /DNA_ID=CAMNT_0013256659 /DNA_START=47 /DNA_END=514 /DNA_ORIENTATION=-